MTISITARPRNDLALGFILSVFPVLFMAGPLARAEETSPRDLFSDAWVATDALGRRLPSAQETGPPRPKKTVGVFYFLWLGRHGEEGPFDIPKILAKNPGALLDPKSPVWGAIGGSHHWGESIFNYYVSDDDAVIRKHSQMLSDAGVDMIVFDVTNQLTYPESWRALCRVFDQERRKGNRVPKIAFLCPFGDPSKVVHELWNDLYGKNLYPELWFRWEGKPLILADPAFIGAGRDLGRPRSPEQLAPGHSFGQSFEVLKPFDAVGAHAPTWESRTSSVRLTLYRIVSKAAGGQGPNTERVPVKSHRLEKLEDNGWAMLELDQPQPAGRYELEMSDARETVGWWGDPKRTIENGRARVDGRAVPGSRRLRIRSTDPTEAEIQKFFTFRKPQPDYFAGPTGPNQWSWLEVYPQHPFYTTPGVAEQVSVGVGQNAAEGKLSVFTYPRAHGRSFHDGQEPGPEGRDMSGRNFAEQWKRALEIDPAFIFVTNWNEWIAGRFTTSNMPLHGAGPVTFVDEFDTEFSRDIEPMKGGHGDNYYYQMIANIRRYKGARPFPPVEPRPIVVDGLFADWTSVGPEFRDTIGDPTHRDHRGWGKGTRYVNQSGRNDLVASKVSFDDRTVSFYAKSASPLTDPTGPGWMLLFLDLDRNAKTGWLGYDVVVNRKVSAATSTTSVERNIGGRYEWGSCVEVPFRVAGGELELTISYKALGLSSAPAAIDFKWADNIRQDGDWSDFTLNGDSAPNDRYNYRALMGRPGR